MQHKISIQPKRSGMADVNRISRDLPTSLRLVDKLAFPLGSGSLASRERLRLLGFVEFPIAAPAQPT